MHASTSRRRSRLARLAAFVTFAAAAGAWFLTEVAHLSERAVVLTVLVVAFVCSWIVTNQRPPVRNHRVTVVRLPARIR